jgi:hypothetical protein
MQLTALSGGGPVKISVIPASGIHKMAAGLINKNGVLSLLWYKIPQL